MTWFPLNQAKRRPVSQIDVRIQWPGTYALYPHQSVDAVLPDEIADRLRAAERVLATPLEATAIQTTLALRDVENSIKTVVLRFRTNQIALRQQTAANDELLDVIYAFYDSQDNRINAGKHSVIHLHIKQENLNDFLKGDHAIERQMPFPANAAKLRAAVRDAYSGIVGSVECRLKPLRE